VILASADLQNWTPITTNVATNTTVVFTDAEAANYTSRFYQAAVTIPGS
jgi:beta-xylosidase